MDSVRLGRVLGIGTRLAARTVAAAVDAATAPNPAAPTLPTRPPSTASTEKLSSSQSTAPPPSTPEAGSTAVRLGKKAAQTKAHVAQSRQGLKRGGRRFGEAVWGPFVHLSGVLWLEFTGVFFGVFALTAAIGVWKLRNTLTGPASTHQAHTHFALTAAMAILFTYFCISSFVKAARKNRRR